MNAARLFPLLVLALGLFTPAARAVAVGQTQDEVLKELGQPASRMALGDVVVLNYDRGRVRLEGGKVVEVDPKLRGKPAAQSSTPSEQAVVTARLGVWQVDYASALKQAQASKAKVFLFFTGSDWCVWCKQLEAEVLATKQFKEFATENFILVKLDFPRGYPQSPVLREQNERLAQRYRVEGYPTVVVVNERGKELGRLGYQPGGPGPFIKQLRKL